MMVQECEICENVKPIDDGSHRCMICSRVFIPADHVQFPGKAASIVTRQAVADIIYRHAESSIQHLYNKLREGGYGNESG